MFIAVDFDGTIVDHVFPEIGQPVPNALEWMKKFHDEGAFLILLTMRHNNENSRPVLTEAVNYLKEKGITLYSVNENPTQWAWTGSNKVYAHVYIDDMCAGIPLIKPENFNNYCVDWDKIGPSILRRLRRK